MESFSEVYALYSPDKRLISLEMIRNETFQTYRIGNIAYCIMHIVVFVKISLTFGIQIHVYDLISPRRTSSGI